MTYGLYFHGKAKEIMGEHDNNNNVSIDDVSYTISVDPSYTFDTNMADNTITLTDPLITTYNSKDLLADFREAQLEIQVLKELLEESGIDVAKRLEQKKFMNKLSGEDNGKV